MQFAFTIFKYFPYGGIQRDMLKLVDECVALGHRARIYTLQWSGDRPPDVEIIVLPVHAMTNHVRYRRFADRVCALLTEHPVDVVVGMNKMPGLDIYFAGDTCYQEKAMTQRGALYRVLPRYRAFRSLEAAVFDAASDTEILTLSDAQRGAFQRFYGTSADRFHALPPGIDGSRAAPADRSAHRDAFRQEFAIDDHELLMLFVGSGFVKKGLDRVLRGFASLPDSLRHNTRLFVIGEDRSRPFEAMVRQLGLASRVRFFRGRDDIPRFLFGADLFVLPAYDETAGMVIVEAVIAGLPVLVTANCGYAHHVATADAGVVLPVPYEQDACDAALADMLQDATLRARWRDNGIAYGRSADLYDMHRHAAAFIVETAQRRCGDSRRGARAKHDPAGTRAAHQLYLRDDLKRLVGDRDPFEAMSRQSGETFRAVAGRRTLRFEYDDAGYFLKFHCGVGWSEILKNLLVGKRPVVDASNEFTATRRLAQAGVGTLHVAGFGRQGVNPATRRSFIVSDELRDRISLEDYCANWCRQPPSPLCKRRLIGAVAHLARAMHGAGVIHRDFYICHLLLDRAALGRGDIELVVIDLHRARVEHGLRRPSDRWIMRDLAALMFSAMDLGLTQRDWFRFIAGYTGEPASRSLRAAPAFWRAVQRRARELYKKGARKGLLKGAAEVPVRSSAGRRDGEQHQQL